MKNQLTLIALAAIVITAAGLYFSSNTISQIATRQGFPLALEETKKSDARQGVRTVFQPFGKTAEKSGEQLTEFILDRPALEQLHREQPQQINVQIPTPAGGLTDIPMEKTELLPTDFKVTVNEDEEVVVDRGVHYQYVGSKDSIAAISVFEDALHGLIATEEGNYSISHDRTETSEDLYAIRLDDPTSGIGCETETPGNYSEKVKGVLAEAGKTQNLQRGADEPVVKVYAELQYGIYRSLGSNITLAQQRLITLFNVSSLIFANDGIKVQLSEARVWTIPNVYESLNTTLDLLYEFERQGRKHNGDLAALLGTVDGGRAFIDQLCGERKFSYSNSSTTIRNFPQWSYAAYVLAHELGHNIGSPHTHNCSWGPNNDSTLDNCAGPEGNCAIGPSAPGTIMSYCQNFQLTNGFGPEPAELLRAFIAESNCLKDQDTYADCPLDSIFWNITSLYNSTPFDITDNLFQVSIRVVSENNTGNWSAELDGVITTYPYNQQVILPAVNSWRDHYDLLITDIATNCSTTREIPSPRSPYINELCTPAVFSKNYGSQFNEIGKAVVALPNGDAIVVGYQSESTSANFWESEMTAQRIDSMGNSIWSISPSVLGSGIIEDVTQLQDGNFIAVGYSTPDENPQYRLPDITLVKFDPEGNLLWRKQLNGFNADKLYSVKSLTNGGVITTGSITSTGILSTPTNGSRDALVMEFDMNGELIWGKSYGGSSIDEAHEITVLSSGGYAIAGTTYSSIRGVFNTRNFIMSIDETGNRQWERILGVAGVISARSSITETIDGNIATGIMSTGLSTEGRLRFPIYAPWLFKFNALDGSTIWQSKIQSGQNQSLSDIIPLPNGDFYTVTQTRKYVNTANPDVEYASLSRISFNGEILWNHLLGGTLNSRLISGALRGNETLVATGWSEASDGNLPGNNGSNDRWVIGFEPDRCVPQAQTCRLSPRTVGVSCSDAGTPNDRTDDTYTAQIVVEGSSLCSGQYVVDGDTLSFGDTLTTGSYFIADGIANLTITDVADPTNETTITVEAPETCSANDYDLIDLELTADVDQMDPDNYSKFSITYTVTNKGNLPERNIVTQLTLPDELVYEGGNEYTSSAGTFQTSNGEWRLLYLGGNASHTLTVNYYNLENPPRLIYGQITAQQGIDDDSTPGNGQPPVPVEDDELVVLLNGADLPICSISAVSTDPICNDNGTPFDPSDDTYTAVVTVSSSNSCSGQWTGAGQSGSYGDLTTVGPFAIASGSQTLLFEDSADPSKTATLVLTPPTTCSSAECILSAQVSNKTCDDNGTPLDPSDDLFEFDILVENTGLCGSTWSDGTTTGSYGQATSFGPFSIAAGSQTLTIADSDSATSFVTLEVLPTEPCSVPPSSIDLELSGLAEIADPDIYSLFSITYTLTNVGSAEETQVIVDIPVPDGLVLEGGNEYTASTGRYSANKWRVPSIAAGTSETITVNYFNLSASAKTVFTEVAEQASEDFDSTPGNGNAPTPTEDDEAAVEINGVAPTVCTIQGVINNITCDDSGTPNDLSDDTWSFDLLVTSNGNCSQNWTSTQGAGNYGVSRTFGPFNISDGDINLVVVELTNPSISTSLTAIAPQPCSVPLICDISATASNISCDDLGTPNDLTDDTWSFDLLVTSNENCGQDWTTTQGNGSYGVSQSFGPFNIADGDIDLDIQDLNDPSITTSLMVVAPQPCSVPLICGISATTTNITCDDLATPNDPTDDTWSFELLVISNENCGQDWTTDQGQGTYGVNSSFGPFNIQNGDLVLTIEDQIDPSARVEVTVVAPAPCSVADTCVITSQISNITCDDNGTENDTSDDLYSFDLTINSSGICSEGWSGGGMNGSYGQAKTFGPYPISGGDQRFSVSDTVHATAVTNVVVEAPLPCSVPSSIVDLELSTTATTTTPDEYSFVSTTFTIVNSGTQAEQGISVLIPTPNGLVLEGGNEYTLTQGAFRTGTNIWTVGGIAAGAQASITLNYFTLTEDEVSVYGQVLAQASTDLDSSPDNGSSPTPLEDDEAVVILNGSGPIVCAIQANVRNITCDDLNTPNDPSDDVWSFDLLVGSNGNCGTGWTSLDGDGTYGTIKSYGPFVIADGDIDFVIQDAIDPTISTTITAVAPAPCSVPLICEIGATTSNITCDNAGTPEDASDDLWSFDLLVNSNDNCGDMWMSALSEGAYGVAQSFGPFNISDGNINLEIQDLLDPSVSISTTVVAPQPCSGAVQGVDLELDLVTESPNPGQWAQVPMQLTLRNAGTETASNIRVDFIDQSNPAVKALLAYTSSSAPAATSFNSWQGIWMIPTLAPGAAVTLDYVGYSKTEDEILIYGEVVMQGQTDVDSSPNNGNGSVAQEDDEASIALNTSMTLTLTLDEELRLYPNPARDYVNVALGAWANGPATLEVRNALGSLVYHQSWDVLSDDVFTLNTSRFPAGSYLVTLRRPGVEMKVLRFGKVE